MPRVGAENTHFICKWKYHCTAALLFDWFRYSCVVYVNLARDLQVWLNPKQSNKRSTIQ